MKFAIYTALYFLGCGLCLSEEVKESPPRVITPLGQVEGYYKISSNGRRYEAYEGIPYAEPPIGNFRFQVARRISQWPGVLMAKQYSSTCLQYAPNAGQLPHGIVSGSEDCLYLNIYTAIIDDDGVSRPDGFKAPKNLLPVILFIHGGAFQYGSGSEFGPKYILDKNITLVTFNYRLGPLGFLSTEDDIVPGNMGLKDQVMAMRWVKDNIKFFGGDPSRVTIAGQSAGGASAHYHLFSNLSSGLFQRGISLSGTALDCWSQTEGSLEKAKKIATILGCPSNDIRNMVDCLRIKPADQITQTIGEFMVFGYNPFSPFGPVVEKGGGNFTFIDRTPIEILASGEAPQDVPWIMSTVSAEGIYSISEFIANPKFFDELNKNWDTIAPHYLDFNYTIPQKDHVTVARLIRQHYFGSNPINRATINQIIKMFGDRMCWNNAEKVAKIQARNFRSPIRFHYFSYRGAHSYSEAVTGSTEDFGVSHSDDISYILDSFFDPTTTARDREMQKVLINIWVSFATDGTPDVGVEWPKLSESCMEEFRYLDIAGPDNISMKSASNFGDKNFWHAINFEENIL